jgi:hypothetical protein
MVFWASGIMHASTSHCPVARSMIVPGMWLCGCLKGRHRTFDRLRGTRIRSQLLTWLWVLQDCFVTVPNGIRDCRKPKPAHGAAIPVAGRIIGKILPPRLASTGVALERVKPREKTRIAAGPRLSFGDLGGPMCSHAAAAACMSVWDRLSRSYSMIARSYRDQLRY